MIGLECSYEGTLKELFFEIPIDSYYWLISEEEVICRNNSYYPPPRMNKEEFLERFIKQENIINFINLQAYLNNTDTTAKIRTYADFEASLCQLIVLISDRTCWEVYAKDNDLLLRLANNFKKFGCKDLTFKTKNSDIRTVLSVF